MRSDETGPTGDKYAHIAKATSHHPAPAPICQRHARRSRAGPVPSRGRRRPGFSWPAGNGPRRAVPTGAAGGSAAVPPAGRGPLRRSGRGHRLRNVSALPGPAAEHAVRRSSSSLCRCSTPPLIRAATPPERATADTAGTPPPPRHSPTESGRGGQRHVGARHRPDTDRTTLPLPCKKPFYVGGGLIPVLRTSCPPGGALWKSPLCRTKGVPAFCPPQLRRRPPDPRVDRTSVFIGRLVSFIVVFCVPQSA
jgi:hypothetical protein